MLVTLDNVFPPKINYESCGSVLCPINHFHFLGSLMYVYLKIWIRELPYNFYTNLGFLPQVQVMSNRPFVKISDKFKNSIQKISAIQTSEVSKLSLCVSRFSSSIRTCKPHTFAEFLHFTFLCC